MAVRAKRCAGAERRLLCWSRCGKVPRGLVGGRLAAGGPAEGLVGGTLIPDPRRASGRPWVGRWQGDALRPVWAPPQRGYVAALALWGSVAWVVVGRTRGGSTRFVTAISEDGGESWELRSLLPAPSLAELRIGPSGAAWAVGRSCVYRSPDLGRSWQRVRLPSGCERPHGPVGFDVQGAALLGGQGLWRSPDGGRSWRLLARRRVAACGGSVVATSEALGIRLGWVRGESLQWGALGLVRATPVRVGALGAAAVVVADPVHEGAGGALQLRTVDGGRSYARARLLDVREAAQVAVWQDRVVARLSADGLLWRWLPPDRGGGARMG